MNEFIYRHYKQGYHRTPKFWVIVVCIFFSLLLLKLIFSHPSKKTKKVPPTVVVAMAKGEDIPVYIDTIGTVVPIYTVTIQTQLNGILWDVFFKEGQMVKKGDLLATIDSRIYEAQLREYEGQLARDKALLENANIDLKRYQTLWKEKAVSQQILQTQISLVKELVGTVQFDQGLVDTTKVTLLYTKITSPIDGRVGLRLIDPGNFVQTTSTTGICVVTATSPIDVIFPVAEDYIAEILQQLNTNKVLLVEVYDRDQVKLLGTGKLLAVDNQINLTTGTVNLKAQFDNDGNYLFPNLFVNVKLLVKTLKDATIVPTASLRYKENLPEVYVVDEKNKVSIRKVKTGIVFGDYTVINKGISIGQKVIVEGIENLSHGITVNPILSTEPNENEKKTSHKHKNHSASSTS